jgi:hypothetical protein
MKNIILHVCIWILGMIMLFFYLSVRDVECSGCLQKDKEKRDQLIKFNNYLKQDSTHRWCIRLQ